MSTEDIMREPPGGENFGRKTVSFTDEDGAPQVRKPTLETGRSFRQFDPGSFGVVDDKQDGGLVAHRGVLHPDEYVDADVLRDAACEAVGFTYAEITAVYRQGLKTPELRQLRERIDSRMLALRRSGGNMTQLADALGIAQSAVDRALKRARSREVSVIVKNPAVTTRLVCFKCGEEGATPRKRRFSLSPEGEVGTINLCGPCYARGFEQRQGNPAYWEFRDRCVA